MTDRTAKTRVLIYSGHGEIVGGDATYLSELLENVDPERFELAVYTDMNPAFERRVSATIREKHHVQYLKTHPRLFRKTMPEKIHSDATERSDSSTIASMVARVMDMPIRGRGLMGYLNRAWQVVTFGWITQRIANARVFYDLFKAQPAIPDVFHVSNGAYPGKEAGLIALIVARH